MSFDPETYERLMLKHLDEQTTPEEVHALSRWLEASPDHRLQYEQLKSVWELTTESPVIPRPDKTKAWANVATRARLRQADDRPAIARKPRSRKWNRAWLALPVLLAGAAILWLLSPRTSPIVEVTALPGQVKTVTLSDDTVVRLHSGSTLTYSSTFNESDRSVVLQGEAYFEVSKAELPFEVQNVDALVRVLGTQFSVRSKHTDTEVVVTEGRVQVMAQLAKSNVLELGPGEGVSVSNSQLNQIDPGTLQDTEDWINGTALFDTTLFPEAINRLSRIWKTPITISKPGLDSETVSGSIRLNNTQQALETLCLTLGNPCSVRLEDDTYIIF